MCKLHHLPLAGCLKLQQLVVHLASGCQRQAAAELVQERAHVLGHFVLAVTAEFAFDLLFVHPVVVVEGDIRLHSPPPVLVQLDDTRFANSRVRVQDVFDDVRVHPVRNALVLGQDDALDAPDDVQ